MNLGKYAIKDIIRLAKELETNAKSSVTSAVAWDGGASLAFTFKNDKQDYVTVTIFEENKSGNAVPKITRTDNL